MNIMENKNYKYYSEFEKYVLNVIGNRPSWKNDLYKTYHQLSTDKACEIEFLYQDYELEFKNYYTELVSDGIIRGNEPIINTVLKIILDSFITDIEHDENEK